MSMVHVELLEKELWKKFANETNEMIVTKSGRRMFPVVKIRITGLNPKAFYEMKLEFVQIGQHRWKFMNGSWGHGGKAESPPCQSVYKHPDSPNLGDFWMKNEGVTFSKVKLTNKPNPANEQVVLNSLHKYQPVVQIIQLDSTSEPCKFYKYDFPGAEFIAVTAYQNDQVTSLKIKHNPFAKAFQDTRERPIEMCYPVTAYNTNLTSLSQLNPNLSALSGNHHLGSSGSGGSLVSSSSAVNNNNNNTNNTGSNYLDRGTVVSMKCGSPANSSLNGNSPNSNNNSPSNLLSSTYANGLCNANAYSASYLSAMNNYYGNNCSATTYQELTNSYHNLQSPDTMVSSNSSPNSYSNLILNTTTNQSPNCNLSNNQCVLSTISEPITLANTNSTINSNNNSSTNGSNSTFLIKTSNSPVATDLSSPNANNLSSSSCSSSSSLSSSSYCERYTPLKNHRTIPYNKTAATVGHHPAASYMNSYYTTWNQQSADQNWTILPEAYYSSVNLQS